MISVPLAAGIAVPAAVVIVRVLTSPALRGAMEYGLGASLRAWWRTRQLRRNTTWLWVCPHCGRRVVALVPAADGTRWRQPCGCQVHHSTTKGSSW